MSQPRLPDREIPERRCPHETLQPPLSEHLSQRRDPILQSLPRLFHVGQFVVLMRDVVVSELVHALDLLGKLPACDRSEMHSDRIENAAEGRARRFGILQCPPELTRSAWPAPVHQQLRKFAACHSGSSAPRPFNDRLPVKNSVRAGSPSGPRPRGSP